MKSCNQRGTCTSHFIRCKMRLTVDYPFPRNPFRFVFPLLFFLSSFLFSFLSYPTNQSLFIFAACNIPKYSTIRVKHSYICSHHRLLINVSSLTRTCIARTFLSFRRNGFFFFNSRRLLKIWKINSKGIQMRHLYSDPVRWWKKQGSEKKKGSRIF